MIDEAEQRQVFEAVLSSRKLKNAERSRRVLAYLEQRFFNNKSSTTDDIGQGCYADHHKPEALPTAVRSAVRHLRKYVEEYFQEEGRQHRYKIHIPLGPQYTIEFQDNAHLPGDCFRKFWAPYLEEGVRNLVLMTSPQFWRDAKLSYIRNIFSNTEADRWQMEYLAGKDGVKQLERSFHYLSAGEAMGAMTLMRDFHLRNAALDFDTEREYEGLVRLDSFNLVLMGSGRTSLLVNLLQQGKAFMLTGQGVQAAGEEGDKYQDEISSVVPDSTVEREGKIRSLAHERWEKTRDQDNNHNSEDDWHWAEREYERQESMKAHRTKKYAILTRMPSPHYGHVITMIAANHGRAAQGVMEFLVNQVKLQTLFERMQIQPNDKLPSSFQIVFQVSVSKLNGEGAPETVTPVEWRIELALASTTTG